MDLEGENKRGETGVRITRDKSQAQSPHIINETSKTGHCLSHHDEFLNFHALQKTKNKEFH